MLLKSKPSLGDYIENFDSQPAEEDDDGPSFDQNFQSLQLQQQKIIIRQGQMERLIQELSKLLKKIYKKEHLEREDKVLRRLRNLKEEAISFNFINITNLIHLAIGKRIAILEIRKKDRFGSYDSEKKAVGLFDLRFLKLQNVKFNQLQHQKIEKRTFIFEPYITGNGFNYESCAYKSFHYHTLNLVDAKNTLHQINRVWYQSYELLKHSKYHRIQQSITVITTIFIVILILVAAICFFFDEQAVEGQKFVEIGLNIIGVVTPVIVFLLLIFVGLQFLDTITEDYQDRLINKRIHEYIAMRNQEMSEPKRKWTMQKQMLWIQLKIEGKIIQDQMGFTPVTTMCTQKILNGKMQAPRSIFLPKSRVSNING